MDEPKKITNDLVEFLDMISGEQNKIPEIKTASINLSEIKELKQALEEQDLITKYGKKRIEDLAKKINYHGAIINKQKNNIK